MRTKYSVINMLVSVRGQIPNLILAFAARAVFVRCLSAEYLGVNGLFSNLLSVLSLAELGIGSAMCYSLYGPLAKGEEDELRRLMNLYRVLYRIVAGTVLCGGLLMFPFLDVLIRNQPDIDGLEIIYLMYLLNSVCSYLLCYKQTIIMADQKAYINSAWTQVFQIVKSLGQIVILLTTGSFIAYLTVQIVCSVMTNLVLAQKADSMYPYLRQEQKELPSRKVRRELFKNIGAMFFHKVGSVLVMNTDNLIISAFIGLVEVGVYSNYLMVLNHLKTLSSYIYGAFTAGIGNLYALEDSGTVYRTYRALFFLMYLIFGYCSAALFVLFNPFIRWCFGTSYILPLRTVSLIVLNFYVWGMRQITLKFRDGKGLYWHDRYKPFFEVVINLGVSMFLAPRYGIDGVVAGTILSSLLTNFWVEPYVLMRYGIKEQWKQRLMEYFRRYGIFSVLAVAAAMVCYWICSFLPEGGFFLLILKGICMTCVYGVIVLPLTCRTEEFRMLFSRGKQIFMGLSGKRDRGRG